MEQGVNPMCPSSEVSSLVMGLVRLLRLFYHSLPFCKFSPAPLKVCFGADQNQLQESQILFFTFLMKITE